ncbi:MAG: hypothetical protein COW66_02655 [Flavobacteriaceae bacterium CG18_big_fil_WC_8_21_14_2_50_34_36]|nr:MAG: hypothetical protein COW66_02655 [Flavobacteriaceae bacterium CG18_big_fil_WC_8_21_14_2_50_34_36]PJC06641.1 MAG: hypothetical protein CO068_10140 [Flavobacteriaceae bacterium CG_4_9_14_0_8_um_filter_34_30]
MRSNYKKLGQYIKQVNIRNNDLAETTLLGVSIQKVLMPSIANIVGTNMKTYKIIKKNQFAYGSVTSRNGNKISIALLEAHEVAIVSQAYTVFEIIDCEKLLPEYLMMWFRRPEFDRYARFKSHGSARETFDWDELCETQLPVPYPEKQREIVAEYNTVQNRIQLNEQLIQKLEETAQAIYREWFVEGIDYENLPEGWEVKPFTKIVKLSGGGTPDTSNETYWNGDIPFFTPADVVDSHYSIKTEKFITELGLKNSSTKLYPKDTVFVTARGTVGALSLAGCPMTMNQSCYAITGKNGMNQFFTHQITLSTIEKLKKEAVGAVFAALVTKDFESQNLIEPDKTIIEIFGNKVKPIYDYILIVVNENQKLSELKDLLLSKLTTVEI